MQGSPATVGPHVKGIPKSKDPPLPGRTKTFFVTRSPFWDAATGCFLRKHSEPCGYNSNALKINWLVVTISYPSNCCAHHFKRDWRNNGNKDGNNTPTSQVRSDGWKPFNIWNSFQEISPPSSSCIKPQDWAGSTARHGLVFENHHMKLWIPWPHPSILV